MDVLSVNGVHQVYILPVVSDDAEHRAEDVFGSVVDLKTYLYGFPFCLYEFSLVQKQACELIGSGGGVCVDVESVFKVLGAFRLDGGKQRYDYECYCSHSKNNLKFSVR